VDKVLVSGGMVWDVTEFLPAVVVGAFVVVVVGVVVVEVVGVEFCVVDLVDGMGVDAAVDSVVVELIVLVALVKLLVEIVVDTLESVAAVVSAETIDDAFVKLPEIIADNGF
jgi:hypothetical protein